MWNGFFCEEAYYEKSFGFAVPRQLTVWHNRQNESEKGRKVGRILHSSQKELAVVHDIIVIL